MHNWVHDVMKDAFGGVWRVLLFPDVRSCGESLGMELDSGRARDLSRWFLSNCGNT